MNQSTDYRPVLTALFIIFVMLICVMWFGWGRFKFVDEEQGINLTTLLERVDASPNNVQRVLWNNKTYIAFLYEGNCGLDDYMNIQTTQCEVVE